MLRPAAALECKLHDSSQEESVVFASLQPWTPLPKVKEEILLAGGFEWKWTYKLLPLVVMTLLVRLLLLLWLVIGRGFGKVFLGNKSWRENANGGQSTSVCWKGQLKNQQILPRGVKVKPKQYSFQFTVVLPFCLCFSTFIILFTVCLWHKWANIKLTPTYTKVNYHIQWFGFRLGHTYATQGRQFLWREGYGKQAQRLSENINWYPLKIRKQIKGNAVKLHVRTTAAAEKEGNSKRETSLGSPGCQISPFCHIKVCCD